MRTLRLYGSALLVAMGLALTLPAPTHASSHREAPLISADPEADNTDVYAFRSPDGSNTITIIANYIPLERPDGGPNFDNFGENIRYEIHIRNQAAMTPGGNGDDITYRFTFTKTNEAPNTFFNVFLGKQNLKATYLCQKSTDGGVNWTTVVQNGVVPPTNIGPRSIETPIVGLGKPYEEIWNKAITNGITGETVFAGPIDDPFFVNLAGIFDLGAFDSIGRDAIAGTNVHTIALKIPISTLQAQHLDAGSATNILDPRFVIGVWASASRPMIKTLSDVGGAPSYTGKWIQVSRLGMPLSNEVIIPIGMKDKFNSGNPYDGSDLNYAKYFSNPEVARFVGGNGYSDYGQYVPDLSRLKLDTASLRYLFPTLGGFNFRADRDGLYPLLGNALTKGTALDTAGGPAAGHFGSILLQKGNPRSADILPIFFTGVPNAIPYQLETGKNPANPLTSGKPFINNFLPILGDMLRLNMAVPATDRNSAAFKTYAPLGLLGAALVGLTAPQHMDTTLELLPNMDGFPNGRRLEDDVVTIEMQAVGGTVLNAIGLFTDDYKGVGSPLAAPHLGLKLGWNSGVTKNDTTLRATFPFVQMPHRGADGLKSDQKTAVPYVPSVNVITTGGVHNQPMALHVGAGMFLGSSYPNPTQGLTNFNFKTTVSGQVTVKLYDMRGYEVATLMNERQSAGDYNTSWSPASNVPNGTYIAVLYIDGEKAQELKLTLSR